MAEVLEPQTAQEAAEMAKSAYAAGRPLKLSARGMTQVAEYEPADLVISVQAGATLADIARAAAPNNQFFALDPAVSAETSIGSIVAANAAGPLRFAHGTPRDQVLGLEVVTGDGRLLEFGGRVVKNVAGYDIVRLMVGSRGRLGFITRVNLKLKPMPAVDRTAAVGVASYDAAVDIVNAIHEARLDPVALEIVSDPSWAVLVRFHGNDLAVSDGMACIREFGRAETLDGDRSWAARALSEAGAAVVLRVANVPSRLRQTMASAQQLARGAELRNARFAVHAGNGIIRILADAAGPRTAHIIADERAALAGHGGSLVAERIPGIHVDNDADAAVRVLMQKITNVFDPAGIFG